MFEPGTTWEYSMSTDVLGRVVEVVSGMTSATSSRRASPGRSAWPTPASGAAGERAARVAEPQADPATGQRPPMRNVDAPATLAVSGGGGVVSTAADYLRFCQMLLNGGELDGVRLLAPKTVALMAADHLPPGVGYGATARGALRGARPGAGDGLRLRPRLRGAHGSRAARRCRARSATYFWGGVTAPISGSTRRSS